MWNVRRAEQPAQDGEALEEEDVPGFHALEQTRLGLGMLREIEVVARCKSLRNALDVGIERGESVASRVDQLEGRDFDVVLEPLLADDLRIAAERLDVGVLELPEVILALRPRRPERDRHVGLAVDVRHAPLVTMDDDRARERVGVRWRRRSGRSRREEAGRARKEETPTGQQQEPAQT